MVFGAIGSRVSWEDFCNHYCDMKPDAYLGVKPIGIRNAGELADGLRPFVLRRTIASLGIELPPLVVDRAPLAGVDPAAIGHAMAGLEGWTPERLAAALEQQDELRDSALARVRRALGIAKALPAAAHVESILASGEGPVVVFFQHTDVRKAMHAALAAGGRVCSWLDGTVTRAQLVAAVDWFQAGRIDVLLVQTQAGGIGISLTRATRAVIVEMPWTATALFQAVKRIHRIGQTRECLAEVLYAQNCWLEDAMGRIVGVKNKAASDLMALLETSK
jgi:SWI/SNF-related matrix-associated actin-dependent regulator 1 of chromatin subfamily A